jgi:DNA-binding CsgD family transcriptional regulator
LHELEVSNTQRETINEKQRELTSTALRMASFQDNINEIIQKCDSNALSKIADVKKELLQLVRQQDYWKQFETRFNNLHPEFSTALTNKFARLTKNDIEFCSLLKLKLSNKEIASLLQISHESVITKKYRIKKKMEINDDEAFEKLLLEI